LIWLEPRAAIAAAVADQDKSQAQEMLSALFDKNLLKLAVSTSLSPRFQMLFTIRAFAQARLDERADKPLIQARHAAYFAGLCQFASDDPAFNMGAHLARLAVEHDNLLAAVTWLTTQPSLSVEQQEQLAWLLRVLPQVFFRYGQVKEGVDWLQRVEAALTQAPLNHQPPILAQFAALVREAGDYEQTAAYLARAQAIAEALQDSTLISRTLLHLSALAGIREEYEQAVALSAQAIALDEGLRRGPMTVEKCHWWQNRALDLKYLGRYAEALALLEEARGFLERQGDQMSLAGILHTIGGVYFTQAEYRAAASYYRQALQTALAINYPRLVWHALGGLAQIAAATEDWLQATTLYSAQSKLSLLLGFASLPVGHRQRESQLGRAQAVLGPAVYRDAWLKGAQTAVEELL
jgi:tetratricopeptide (TPR) repeat protein